MRNLIRALACTVLLAALPALSQAAVFVSVNIAPPALPVYELPPVPGPGYLWTPGYWAWDGAEYYWVPGTWVLAPVGLLWTPGYWGWNDGAYVWNEGYWGPQVGFYGGVDYGFGYPGVGFRGGEWRGREFVENRTVINNVTVNRVSFNGGQGGIVARPTEREMAASREHHEAPIGVQRQQQQMASQNREMRASVNGGRPSIAATPRPGVFSGAGIVPARNAARGGGFRTAERPNEGSRGNSTQAPGSAEPQRAAPRGGFGQQPQREERVPARPQETRPQERPMPQARPPQPQREERPQQQERPQQREQQREQQHPQQRPQQQREERPQQREEPQKREERRPDEPHNTARVQQAHRESLVARQSQQHARPERVAHAPQSQQRPRSGGERQEQRQARNDPRAEHPHGGG